MKKINSFIVSSLAAGFLIGCGGGGGTSSNTIANPSTTLTVVDPYIQDAIMYHDENNNGIYDNGEQLSDKTTQYGNCTFTPALPEGAKIRMHTKGVHNGVPFDGDLSANLTGTGVVSPLTTLVEKFDGDTDAVLELLSTNTGISLTLEDLEKDPMANIDASSATLDEDIKRIQASIAVNTFLTSIGTDADATTITNEIATLQKTSTLIKKAITSEKITSSSANSVIQASVTVANYVKEKIVAGDTTILDTVIDDNDSTVETLMTNVINVIEADPTKSVALDTSKDITEVVNEDAIVNAEYMTALQFFTFSGNSLEIGYSGGFTWQSDTDNNGNDDLDPSNMGFTNFQIGDETISLKDIWFDWDWNDYDSDGIYNEYVNETVIANGNLTSTVNSFEATGDITMTQRDESTYEGTFIFNREINGNAALETGTLTFPSFGTETFSNKILFISANKVTEIAGINVGSPTRTVYKVKTKSQEGQLDDDGNFVASGNGYEIENFWDCGFSTIEEYIQNALDNSWVPSGHGNSNLRFAADGTFVDVNSGEVDTDTNWQIVDGILQIRAYDDMDIKIIDGQCGENWIGEVSWVYTNVTKEESEAIMKALAPEHSFTIPTTISDETSEEETSIDLTVQELLSSEFLSVGDDWYNSITFDSTTNELTFVDYNQNENGDYVESAETFSVTLAFNENNNKEIIYTDTTGEEGLVTLTSTTTISGYTDVYKTTFTREVTKEATSLQYYDWDWNNDGLITDLTSLVSSFTTGNTYVTSETDKVVMIETNGNVVEGVKVDTYYEKGETVVGTWEEDTENGVLIITLEDEKIYLKADSNTISEAHKLSLGYIENDEFISGAGLYSFKSYNF